MDEIVRVSCDVLETTEITLVSVELKTFSPRLRRFAVWKSPVRRIQKYLGTDNCTSGAFHVPSSGSNDSWLRGSVCFKTCMTFGKTVVARQKNIPAANCPQKGNFRKRNERKCGRICCLPTRVSTNKPPAFHENVQPLIRLSDSPDAPCNTNYDRVVTINTTTQSITSPWGFTGDESPLQRYVRERDRESFYITRCWRTYGEICIVFRYFWHV